MPYQCPVCGLGLEYPPENQYICPCCGTEFGYEDFAETLEGRAQRWHELRQRWINRDMPWFSRVQRPPNGWDPRIQVMNLATIRAKEISGDQTAEPVVTTGFWYQGRVWQYA